VFSVRYGKICPRKKLFWFIFSFCMTTLLLSPIVKASKDCDEICYIGHCILGCSDFAFSSQIWWSPPWRVFLRTQELRIWKVNFFGFSRFGWFLALFAKRDFFQKFSKFITKARMKVFFQNIHDCHMRALVSNSKNISSLPGKLHSPGIFKIRVKIIK